MLDFRFSGQKIYPGKGIRFIRSDSQVYNGESILDISILVQFLNV
ncbi:putative ribosomal protein L24e [Helianthus anomalus]